MDPFFGKGIDKIIDGAAEGPIKTLNTTWDLIFGGYHNWVAKIQYKRELDLIAFKNSIEQKITTIPTENLIEPQLSLLGPAIEASKFYISENYVRELFANLIASSMDSRKSKNIHHSFVEIIKQMSSNDAKLFDHLSKQFVIPSVRYKTSVNHSGSGSSLSDAIIAKSPLTFEETEISLVNLNRVGLIDIDIGFSAYTDESHYYPFNSPEMINEFYRRIENKFSDSYKEIFDSLKSFTIFEIATANNVSVDTIYSKIQPMSVEIQKGKIEVTSFGHAFISCCLK
ncbi:DUF4393 domain-containing protein [Macrococcoides canis]|uniref:DUF4393 domain-containing protein n=1 Tax=Macrococcoides canis TaxID=1855823 RepID=A0A4R6C6M5_9STAP|nr:DUF4393 domain-containing protein [Macrococcus canis]TDM18086.1 DUF4393 domain-containing protein [Macrococcus canis]